MKAMILAAGLGTRLRPLTDIRPKSLFPVYNTPLLSIIIEQLKGAGVTELAVNTHWLAHMIKDCIENETPEGINIMVSYEPEILGTGGGIKKIEEFWDKEPFIVVNGDIFHNIDLTSAYAQHKKSKSLATLILHDCPRFNTVEVDEENNIVGLRGKRLKKSASLLSLLAFTGIQIISPELLKEIPEEECDIITLYQKIIPQGAPVRGLMVNGHYWRDMGSLKDYHQLHRDLFQERNGMALEIFRQTRYPVVGADSSLGEGAAFKGCVSIGNHCKIGKGCVIKNSIIWNHVEVADNLTIANCIIGDGAKVAVSLKDEVIIRNIATTNQLS